MSDALRELLASFVVEVDKAGELAKGNAAIDALKARLGELQDTFRKVKAPAEQAASAISDAFSRAGLLAQRNMAAIAASELGGRASNTGFGDLAGMGAKQFGPTRDTLNAGRAQMRAAEQAAAAYAQTLRGKLVGAVDAVRAGFTGGGQGGGGPGLIASLATVRNGFLALGAGAAVHAVKRVVDGIGSIGEGAAKLGVTGAQFQRLKVLAAQSDTSVESLGGAFRNLANAAAQPTKATAEAFARLGVSTKDANGELKSSNDLFWDVSRGLAGVGNETERSALAQDLLGRSAQDLKAIFSSGAGAVDRQREALEKLGVLSDETVKSADEASDMWAGFGLTLLAAAEPILGVLLPALVSLTKTVSKGVEWVGKWLKHTDLASVAITALGAALWLRAIPGLQLMVGLGGGVTKSLLGIAGAGAKAAWSFLKVALPLLAIEDFITFLRGGESATGDLLDLVFGDGEAKETVAQINELGASFKNLWKFMNGDGAAETTTAVFERLASALASVLSSTLLFGKDGMGGLSSIGQSKGMSGYSRDPDPFLDQSMQAPPGYYGPPTADGSVGGNSVVVGDSVVHINMGPGASAADVGREVSGALEQSRDAIIAGRP